MFNKENQGLFSFGHSFIKGWNDKIFFVDDSEWDKIDAELEILSRWKLKTANPNKNSLTLMEWEDVKMLIRGNEDVLDVFHFMSLEMLDASKIYETSSHSGGVLLCLLF